ncbi:MAG: LuxR C-terminal-related transcriptional regulator [Anaerovoracaceae bacterium]
MPRKKTVDYKVRFRSKRLEEKMHKIGKYPLIVLEAPMGYGKTAYARAVVKESGDMYIWLSALDSAKNDFWESFCRMIAQLDENVSGQLLKIGFPEDINTAGMAGSLISTIKLQDNIIFVIDDYHFVRTPESDAFFEAVARERMRNLHFMLIGRCLFDSHREELKLKNLLLTISWYDFKLTEEECRRYVVDAGIRISEKEHWKLYQYTEGWITAIYLELQEYAASSSFEYPLDITDLFEKSIYSSYNDDYKDFLMRICVFSTFTKEQARFVRRKDDPLLILEDIVASNGFIRWDPKAHNYHIHSMFSKFLRNKLKMRDVRYRNEVFRHAADWHYLNGQFFRATLNYYRSGNFEDMLKSFERGKGRSLSGRSKNIMIEAFSACPEKILSKYPMAVMIYARQLSMMNEPGRLQKTLQFLKECVRNEDIPERERLELKGEYYMLLSFLSYNDIRKMTEFQKKAARFLKKPSSIEDSHGSWTYGAPSVLFMFYRNKNSLNQLVQDMYDSRDIYYHLTNNNGRGGEYILEAEKEFFNAHIDRAEILSFKALNVAHKYRQVGVMICAYFLQARIYVFKGDADKSLEILDNLRDLVTSSEQYVFIHTADVCKSFIYAQFNQIKSIEPWILDGDFEDMGVYHPAKNFLYIVYARILINQEEHGQLLGLAENFFSAAREFPNLLTEIYLNICVAVSYNKLGMRDLALDHIKKAVEDAYEDKLYMPFVENSRSLYPFLQNNELCGAQRDFADKCRQLYKKYKKNLNVMLKEGDDSPLSMLTKREREISMLVAEGKTNMEIAKQLNVAEITIKKSLSNIYNRLGINNRASLSKKISTN